MARRPRGMIPTALVMVTIFARPSGGESDPQLRWPLEVQPRGITGTFMEPRERHYHSGLDIRTQGRTGLRVLAPADGWVSRVRVSPEGYGKAVYLRLADGRTLVFAHLSHFADRLQAEVARAQSRAGVYEQDLRFPEGQLPFVGGELLALSGATGTGAPHLHLEVRDGRERPQNPLTHGFTVPDREPPQVTGFRLVALDPQSRIEGLAQARAFDPEATVAAAGRLGLQIELIDTTGITPHTLMPLGLAVAVDGEVVYRIEQQFFDFAQGGQMRLEIVADPARKSRWLRAYRHRANDLPERTGTNPHATFVIANDDRTRRVDVRSWDAAGNESRAGFWLTGHRPPALRQAATRSSSTVADGPWSLQIDPEEAVLQIRVAGPLEDPAGLGAISLELDSPGRERPLHPEWTVQGRELCAAVEYGLLASGRVRARLIDRESGETWAEASLDLVVGGDRFEWTALADGRIALDDAQGKGLYAGGAVWGRAQLDWPALPAGTRAVMGPWELRASAVFNDGAQVAVRLPEGTDTKGLGLFLQDAEGAWSLLGDEIVDTTDASGAAAVYLRGELDTVGLVGVLRDLDPPYLGRFAVDGEPLAGVLPVLHPRASRAKNGVTLPRWPTIELPLVDAGAGLSAAGVVAELDGRPFPARWDPEGERLYFDFETDPGEGVHRARVVATDELGNSRESRLQFELRDF